VSLITFLRDEFLSYRHATILFAERFLLALVCPRSVRSRPAGRMLSFALVTLVLSACSATEKAGSIRTETVDLGTGLVQDARVVVDAPDRFPDVGALDAGLDLVVVEDVAVDSSADIETAVEDAGADAEPINLGGSQQILFVGNSYTYANQLPELYLSVARSADVEWDPLRAEMVAYGGYTLPQHAADALGTTELAKWLVTGTPEERDWDTVVLQEQSQIPGFPSQHPETIASFQAAVDLSAHVHALGARVVLFMTWGYRSGDDRNTARFPDYPTMQAFLADGYREMRIRSAQAGGEVVIAPVGLAYQLLYDEVVAVGADPADPTSAFGSLYSGDGKHPGPEGSYLASLVIFGTATGSPVGSLDVTPTGISDERAATLRRVAQEALDNGPCGPCRVPTPVCDTESGRCVE
jgi:hypothetical protein